MFARVINTTMLYQTGASENRLRRTRRNGHLVAIYEKNAANVQNLVITVVGDRNWEKSPQHL